VRFGSVCSGIEAASVAWEPLGWKPAWYSQFDPEHNYKSGPDFASAVLAHHYPNIPNLGDITKIYDNETFKQEPINILIGGTPCPSFSVNGFRKGLRDPRGALALTYCRIAEEKQPPWIVWENVPGVLTSGDGRDFAAFLGKLEELGYSLAYRVLDAQYFGVPQRRKRVFVVGHRGDDFAQFVLFDGKGGSWDAPPRPPGGRPPEASPRKVPENHSTGIESSSGEVSRCLLASGTGRNINAETLLSEGDDVRKLMPVEWERLQGFADDYTRIPWRKKPAELCPDSPRYRALGNSIAVPVLRWIGERIAEIDALVEGTDQHVVPRLDPAQHAKMLDDEELIERCVEGFRSLREIAPYLREARDRFAQPGRRVPVPGNPTWTEWVETNLHVTVRRVQQILSEGARPSEIISPGSKQGSRKLRTGDWRSLLKATERRTAQVFGPLEDQKELAGAIRKFAQAVADRYSHRHGRLVVSVSVKCRK
jgi:DNA (cytosine-5)-methyltransferase 1